MKNLKFTTLFYILFTTTIQAQDSENINLLYQWSVDTLIGSEAFDNVYNEVWGVVVDDREYAIIGSTAGTHFFDVTNPSTASEIAFVAGRVVGDEIIHRDYHDYQNYLYAVSDEGLSSYPPSFPIAITNKLETLLLKPVGVPYFFDSIKIE